MKIEQVFGRCLPKQIQFKREFADFGTRSNWAYVTLGKLCQTLDVAEGSSKPEAAHCQNRYPSPNEWSDHTRVRPLTPFAGSAGQEHACFGLINRYSHRSIVVVGETIPCDISFKVAHQGISGAKTSGESICSILSKSLAFWASWQPCRPVRAAASNVRPSVPLVALWPRPCWIPTWLAAHCLAAWLGRPATKPVYAPTNRRITTRLRAVRASRFGSPFAFAGAA